MQKKKPTSFSPALPTEEDPLEVELHAIREAGRRRLRGEVTQDELELKSGPKRIFYRHRVRYSNGDVTSALAFNPLIYRKR
jgi:hypothetical protein